MELDRVLMIVFSTLAGLNSLGVFFMLYKTGYILGQNDQKWKDLYNRLGRIEDSTGDSMKVTVEVAKLEVEIASLRGRIHRMELEDDAGHQHQST